ncbi:MAG TPA: F0F1 ATP synthase subunit B [Stellaceae bacterium]|nr:F0F1 ATP synthase subunit B [Stellaceae bacterium]
MSELLHDPEFWVLIAGILCIAAIWKPVRRMIVGALDARGARIRAELDEARSLVEEAERALAEHQRRQRDAAAEAEEIRAQARAAAGRLEAEASKSLALLIERRRHLASERIAQAQAAALAEIRSLTVDIAIAAARDIIAASLDAARGNALIDAAIGALPQQLH